MSTLREQFLKEIAGGVMIQAKLCGRQEGDLFMEKSSLHEELRGNRYPGRGIVLGRSKDGSKAMLAYFIMGRSENSRNRIFARTADGIRTEAFDPAKLSDPSLIIYAPVRCFENRLIVSNGDQTDTIYEGFRNGKSFAEALSVREFEPDAPNYTPRISGVLYFADRDFSYELSILKSDCMNPAQCLRFTYSYPTPLPGEGHLIHTYIGDGNPLQSFCGEPKSVSVDDELEPFAAKLWEALDPDNKISLYVRETDLASGAVKDILINRHEKMSGGTK